jgi:uroporphyrinogen decarboxylase
MLMNPWERITAAVTGRPVDRVPWAFWRHFPGRDLSPRGLAEATLAFHRRFGFDLVKVTPAGAYAAEAWGARLEPKRNEEGTRAYLSRVVSRPEDWRRLRAPSLRAGVFGRELRALGHVARGVRGRAPVLQTVFSPLSIARNLAGDLWIEHLRRRPADFAAGLERIAESTQAFARACLRQGADGIFYATQVATTDPLTAGEHRRFGEAHDRRILGSLRGGAALLVLHVHGLGIRFDRVRTYPVDVLNWHDRRTPPSLAAGRRRFGGAVLGGLDEYGAIRHGTPAQARQEAERSLRAAGRRGVILGAGCVLSTATPAANIEAAGRARE